MQKLFFGKGAPSRNRIYFWNLASSMVYTLQSAILLLVITRAGGLFAAGTFSAVYAITQTLTSLGSYSMRNYQVSDIRDEYGFSTYFSSRVVTSLVMVMHHKTTKPIYLSLSHLTCESSKCNLQLSTYIF